MRLFPRLDLAYILRLKPPPTPTAQPCPRHERHREGRFWLCSGCWRASRSAARPLGGYCRGEPSIKGLTGGLLFDAGHKLIVLDYNDGEGILIACLNCKYYTCGGQVRNLTKKCVGPPRNDEPADHGRRYDVPKILQGKHPKASATLNSGAWLDDRPGRFFVFTRLTAGSG